MSPSPPCPICRHAQRVGIDWALAIAVPLTAIADAFGVADVHLIHHGTDHLHLKVGHAAVKPCARSSPSHQNVESTRTHLGVSLGAS